MKHLVFHVSQFKACNGRYGSIPSLLPSYLVLLLHQSAPLCACTPLSAVPAPHGTHPRKQRAPSFFVSRLWQRQLSAVTRVVHRFGRVGCLDCATHLDPFEPLARPRFLLFAFWKGQCKKDGHERNTKYKQRRSTSLTRRTIGREARFTERNFGTQLTIVLLGQDGIHRLDRDAVWMHFEEEARSGQTD